MKSRNKVSSTVPKRGRGRPKSNHLPYSLARDYVQRFVKVTTRKQYWDWHKLERPLYLPSRPESHYDKDWVGWNDFLGTDGSFEKTIAKRKKIEYLDYWSAVHSIKPIVAEYNITCKEEWLAYCDEHGTPERVPKRPRSVYGKQFSWFTFLSRTVSAKVEASVNVVQVIAIVRVDGGKANEVRVVLYKDGRTTVKPGYIRLFENENGALEMVHKVLAHYGSRQPDDYYILSGTIDQVMWDLMDLKLIV